jgi:hypothetical protein
VPDGHSFSGPSMQVHARRRTWNAVGFVASVLFAASSLAAGTRVTLSRVPLHISSAADSQVVGTVPAGVQLSVDFCSKGWCRTSWNSTTGWVAERSLEAPKTNRKRSGKGYINSDGQRIPSPRQSPSGPPPGASAQCSDGSYSFSTHRRGTCSHHGGVRRWL